jgi:hypothetical protein
MVPKHPVLAPRPRKKGQVQETKEAIGWRTRMLWDARHSSGRGFKEWQEAKLQFLGPVNVITCQRD